jgi:hypothetical protein
MCSIMARERHFTSPIFPPLKPTRYECTNCGSGLPATGWPKEAFILVEED